MSKMTSSSRLLLLENNVDNDDDGSPRQANETSSSSLDLFNQRVLSLLAELSLPYRFRTPDERGGTLLCVGAQPNDLDRLEDSVVERGNPLYGLLDSAQDGNDDDDGEDDDTQQMQEPLLGAPAPGLLVEQGGEEEEEEESASAPARQMMIPYTLFRNPGESTLDAAKTFGKVLALIALGIFIGFYFFKESFCNNDHHTEDSQLMKVLHCAATLTTDPKAFSSPDTPQFRAALWMAGRDDPPVTGDCSWHSNFGMLYSLGLLRESLKITDPSWYSESLDVCHWAHVHCTDGHVLDRLTLNHANLTGSLPTELAGIQHLKMLEVYSNPGITGTIPTQLGSLTTLTHVKLQQTGVAGTIPTELGHLVVLEELLLHDTKLTGSVPHQVCHLPLLTHILVDKAVDCACCPSSEAETAWLHATS